MSDFKVKVSSSISVPYSFKDNSGREISGTCIYSMLSDGFGKPQIVKVTAPLSETVELLRDDLMYDYKQRLVTDKF